MTTFTSTRPHIARLQRYERRRAKVLKAFDTILTIAFYTTIMLVLWVLAWGLI